MDTFIEVVISLPSFKSEWHYLREKIHCGEKEQYLLIIAFKKVVYW